MASPRTQFEHHPFQPAPVRQQEVRSPRHSATNKNISWQINYAGHLHPPYEELIAQSAKYRGEH